MPPCVGYDARTCCGCCLRPPKGPLLTLTLGRSCCGCKCWPACRFCFPLPSALWHAAPPHVHAPMTHPHQCVSISESSITSCSPRSWDITSSRCPEKASQRPIFEPKIGRVRPRIGQTQWKLALNKSCEKKMKYTQQVSKNVTDHHRHSRTCCFVSSQDTSDILLSRT